MKIKQVKQSLRALSLEDLISKQEEMAKALLELRLNRYTTHVKDYSQLQKNRREIARVLTIVKEKYGQERKVQKNK